MAKEAKKKTGKRTAKTTDWSQGQPLPFPKEKTPTDPALIAREVVKAAIGETLNAKA